MSARAESGRRAAALSIGARAALAATVACGSLLMGLAAAPAQAAPSERTRPTAVESMAKVPVDDARPTVRCWQYGRLVYEATNVQLVRERDGDSAAAAVDSAGASPPAGKGQRRVRVLDLRQGLCIVE